MKKLREEGFIVGRNKVRRLMKTLGLAVTQRLAYKVTTKRKHSDKVAANLLNQNFNPVDKDCNPPVNICPEVALVYSGYL